MFTDSTVLCVMISTILSINSGPFQRDTLLYTAQRITESILYIHVWSSYHNKSFGNNNDLHLSE